MRESSHDKFPFVAVPGVPQECAVGWDKIAEELRRAIARGRTEKPILVVECYPGVDELTVLNGLQSRLAPTLTIRADEAYHPPARIEELIAPFLQHTGPVERFNNGRSPRLSLVNFFDAEPLWRFRRTIDELKSGLVLIIGCGASLIAWGHTLVYAGLSRREARQRFRGNETGNLGADNKSAPASLKQKRAANIDWPVADRWKRPLIKRWDYVLDTNSGEPKLADAADVRRGLRAAVARPFRTVASYASSAEAEHPNPDPDGTLEENSLLLDFGGSRIEVPAVDLLFYQPRAFLGEAVHVRFGYEFPIGFGFQKTIGRLSEPLAHSDGWREERVGADERTGIEMRRHWFSKTIEHDTDGGVNVLKLVEGDEAVIESPDGAFEPFVVHLGETFIVPAAVGRYNIRPHGASAGKEIVTFKAFVRIGNFGNRMP